MRVDGIDGARTGAGREEDALVAAFVADAADGGVGGVHGCGSQSCGAVVALTAPAPDLRLLRLLCYEIAAISNIRAVDPALRAVACAQRQIAGRLESLLSLNEVVLSLRL